MMFCPSETTLNLEALRQESPDQYAVVMVIIDSFCEGIAGLTDMGLTAVKKAVTGLMEKGWLRIVEFEPDEFGMGVFDVKDGQYKAPGEVDTKALF